MRPAPPGRTGARGRPPSRLSPCPDPAARTRTGAPPPPAAASHPQFPDEDPLAIVDAEPEAGGKLHVPRLADEDGHVRILVARRHVVGPQGGWRAVPDGERALGSPFLLDDVEQDPIDGDRV